MPAPDWRLVHTVATALQRVVTLTRAEATDAAKAAIEAVEKADQEWRERALPLSAD